MAEDGKDLLSFGNTCVNPGNPLFSCDKTSSQAAAGIVPEPQTKEHWSKKQHPMYMTSSSSYGAMSPTVADVPHSFHGQSQAFSEHLQNSGMYRNHSLNTAKDKSYI